MAKTIKQFFPLVTANSTWDDMNGELVIYYGELNIPITTEDSWMETASALAGSPAFAPYGVASPESFQNWQDWITDFSLAVNGKTS